MEMAASPLRRRPIALLRVAGLAPVVTFLRGIGAPVERRLSSVNLPPFILDDSEALISLRQGARFMEESARESGIDNLGLLAGRATPIDALGVFGALIRRSRTVREAIDTLMRMMPAFSSGVRYELADEGHRVRMRPEFVDGIGTHQQADEYCLTVVLNVLRLAAEPRWWPDDVLLETRSMGGSGNLQVLPDARVLFRQSETAITFPKSLLSRPLGPAHAARPMEYTDVEAWKASSPAADLPGSVLQVIETLSSPDHPRIGATADAIGISVRALQRRLAEVGVSYGRLVAQARFTTAVYLLERTDATVLEIALDLGYSDHAHFTRAFRRWTGVAPREFRRVSLRSRGTSTALCPQQRSPSRGSDLRPAFRCLLAVRSMPGATPDENTDKRVSASAAE
jgi:AraC-like DNA-binding protein